MATSVREKVVRKDTDSYEDFVIQGPDGALLDITGDALKLIVVDKELTEVLSLTSAASQIEKTNPAGGLCRVLYPIATTATVDEGTYKRFLFISHEGDCRIVASGVFTVLPSVGTC